MCVWSKVLYILYYFNWVITVLCWCKRCIIVRTAILKTGVVVVTQPSLMLRVTLTPIMSNWAFFTPDVSVRFNKIYSSSCSFYIVLYRVVGSSDWFYMVFTQVVCDCPSVIILCVPILCDSTECTLWWPGDNEIKTQLLFLPSLSFYSPICTGH